MTAIIVANPQVAQPITGTPNVAAGTTLAPAFRRILTRCARVRLSHTTSNASSTAVMASDVRPTASGPPGRNSGIAPLTRNPIAVRSQDNSVRSAWRLGLRGC